jgi:tRNA threonylcarbamoyladenosine biosynthesis protein TsaB
MKVIALDSSGLVASVAVVEDDILLAEYTTNNKQTHSQTLLPMLDEIKKILNLDLKTIDAIALSAGPGSFTGLRIGAATAKGLGLALDKPLLAVPTIDGLAYNLCGSDQIVCPILDARRGQVYTGIYEFHSDFKQNEMGKEANSAPTDNGPGESNMTRLLPQCVVTIDEIVEQLNSLGRKVIFLGDAVPVFKEKLAELMKVPYVFAPAHLNRQRASTIGTLGLHMLKQGMIQTAEEFVPEYLRLSQAEREQLLKEELKEIKKE